MEQYLYFLVGMICMLFFIKLILPHPKKQYLIPNIKNYNDITYIDEEGKIYKYELIEVKK